MNMFNNTTKIEKMNAEVLANIASFLSLASILQFSLTCKSFCHLIQDEHVFRRLSERDFGLTDKQTESWVDTYKTKQLTKEEEKKQPQIASAPPADSETIATTTEESTTTVSMTTADEGEQQVTESVTTTVTSTETPAATEEQPVAEEDSNMETDTISNDPASSSTGGCPHIVSLADLMLEIKRVLYRSENKSLCDICLTNEAAYLNMSSDNHNEACLSCLNKPVEDENHYPIQLELGTGDLYCFKCESGSPLKLTEDKDGLLVKQIVEYMKAPESEDDLDKRRKAEQFLYIQELRREDMSLMHYLVEKQWGRNWMLFRTREGSPLPTKISNNKLARLNGTLDPNIRLPMDKYRPSPETHGDIISEKLWSYLSKAYGVQGKAYNEDDIFAPEYARLRVYVDDFKKSIHLYP